MRTHCYTHSVGRHMPPATAHVSDRSEGVSAATTSDRPRHAAARAGRLQAFQPRMTGRGGGSVLILESDLRDCVQSDERRAKHDSREEETS